MSFPVRFAHLVSGIVAALALGGLVASCGGTAVFDAPDPKACASGHGCPMVACACGDNSVILDTTCESGDCQPPESVCNDRCAAFGGPLRAFATDDDEVPVPACDTFCRRLDTNGCELGCDTLFSECLAPQGCSPEASAFWNCIVTDAVLTCQDNFVRAEGCDSTSMGVCSK